MGDELILNVGVLEDQAEFVEDIKKCLQRWGNEGRIYSLDVFTGGNDLVDKMDEKEYDILFLDIVLDVNEGESGISVAHRLRKAGYSNVLVFVTKFSEYMEQGYDVQIYRYCSKPIQYDKFLECMNYAADKKLGRYFIYSFNEEYRRIPYSSILYFVAHGHSVYIHTDTEILKMATTAKKILEVIPSYFVKCHRAYIVNLERVKKFKGNYLYMDNGEKMLISQLSLPAVRQAVP